MIAKHATIWASKFTCPKRSKLAANADRNMAAMALGTCDDVEDEECQDKRCQKQNKLWQAVWLKYWFTHISPPFPPNVAPHGGLVNG